MIDIDELEKVAFEAGLQKIALRCRWDLFFLAKHVLGYDLMEEDVHGDLCLSVRALLPSLPPDVTLPPATGETLGLTDQFNPAFKNLLALMPRGTFKTSVLTIGFALQYVLNDPNCRILLDSETFGKSKAFLMELKGHLEHNEKFRAVFHAIHGCFPDDKKKSELWSDSQLVLACRTRWRKEPTVSCAGVDVTKNGMHYDLIIGDDLHSEKNVTTKEQIDQVIQHYKLLLSLLDPGMALVIIGTRWDYNDLYQHILDNERYRFNILIRRAIKDDGSLLFPSRLTRDFLENTKRTQGSYIFSCQYLNEPVDDESATFKRSQIVRRDWETIKDRPINWYLSIDPSYEGEYSDFAAFVIAGMDYQRDLFVRHVLRQKMTYGQIITTMFELYYKFRVKRIFLETIAAQKSIMVEINNEMKRRGDWLPLEEIKYREKSKEERIRGLAPAHEFGHIFYSKECPQLDDLEYELLHFPRGKHDDMIDALATIAEFATPPSAKQKDPDTIRRKKRVLYKPRSPITGV